MGAISVQEPVYRHRKLVTEVPGLRSQAFHARRAATVARGVASALPIYIQTMRDGDHPGRARHIMSVAKPLLDALANDCPAVAEVRGRGAMLAIEVVKPGTLVPDAQLAQAVGRACLGAGVVVLTCGTYGNVLRLLPALSIDDDVLLEGLTVLTSIVGRLGQ